MDDTHTRADPLTALCEAEARFQAARARLQAAEEARYASIWAALIAADDLIELRTALPPTVTAHSIRAAVRRHSTGDTGYIQPELFEQPNPEDRSTAESEGDRITRHQ